MLIECDRDSDAPDYRRQRDMPYTLSRFVAMPGPEIHGDGTEHIRNGNNETLLDDRVTGVECLLEAGDDCRQKKAHGIKTINNTEIDECKSENAWLRKGFIEGIMVTLTSFSVFVIHFLLEPVSFTGFEPRGIFWLVCKIKPAACTKKNSW